MNIPEVNSGVGTLYSTDKNVPISVDASPYLIAGQVVQTATATIYRQDTGQLVPTMVVQTDIVGTNIEAVLNGAVPGGVYLLTITFQPNPEGATGEVITIPPVVLFCPS